MHHMTIDTGNTAFMLLCSSLVMLMTPGLAFFYGGLVGRKNVLAIMMQSFVSLGWTTVLWWACGFSMCFSGGEGGVIGNFHMAFLRHVGLDQAPGERPGGLGGLPGGSPGLVEAGVGSRAEQGPDLGLHGSLGQQPQPLLEAEPLAGGHARRVRHQEAGLQGTRCHDRAFLSADFWAPG